MGVSMNLKTVANIAKENGVPLHRIDYLIHRLAVRPAQRVGNVRLYEDEGVARITAALHVRRLSSVEAAAV